MNLEPIVRLFGNAIGFINAVLVPFIFAIAFIAFLWGVFQYFIAGGASEEKRETGKQFVMWSVIGFAIMFSLWGIVNLLVSSAGFGSQTRPQIPQFDPSVSGSSAQHQSANSPTINAGGSGLNQGAAATQNLANGKFCSGDAQCSSGYCNWDEGGVCRAKPTGNTGSAVQGGASTMVPGSVPSGGTCKSSDDCASQNDVCIDSTCQSF